MWKILPGAVAVLCVLNAQPKTGVIPVHKSKRLIVASRGRVKVQGETRRDIGYVLTPRQGEASLSSWSDPVTIKAWLVSPSRLEEAIADLDLRVPRTLAALILESMGGDIEAYDLDGDLSMKARGGRITFDRIAGNASVKSGGGEIRIGNVGGSLNCFSAAGSIRVDSAGEMHCDTQGGEIYIRESRGALIAKTAGGNIHIDSCAGKIEAETGGGIIDIGKSGGAVIATTGSGSIQIASAPSAKCESGNGAIRLKGVSGTLEAVTRTGTILLELPSYSPLEGAFLQTGGGDVVVLIPSNLSVTVFARSYVASRPARIISEFPQIRVNPGFVDGVPVAKADGSIHGGGPELKIEAHGGTIYLRKQK